jgi:hypothetical protein
MVEALEDEILFSTDVNSCDFEVSDGDSGFSKGAMILVRSAIFVSDGVGVCWAWQARWRLWKSNL